MKLLENISSIVPSMQSEAISRKIKQKVQNGEILSTEASNKMAEEIRSLQRKEISRLYNFDPFLPSRASSEQYNSTLDGISLDMQIAFQEINNFFLKIYQHKEYQKNTQIELEKKIKELESQIQTIQLEEEFEISYENIWTNEFSNKSRLSFDDKVAPQLMKDKRTSTSLESKHRATIDDMAKKLTLPHYSNEDVRSVNVEIVETETSSSEEGLGVLTEDIRNILLNDPQKIWTYNTVSKSKIKGGAKLVLDFDLGDKKEVSQIDIELNSEYPLILNKFVIIDELGIEMPIFEGAKVINDIYSVLMPKTTCRRIRGYFSQDNAELISVDSSKQLGDNLSNDERIQAIRGIAESKIKDPVSLNAIALKKEKDIIYNTYFNYTFGIKNIRVQNKIYGEKGIYISNRLETKRPTIVALDANDNCSLLMDPKTKKEYKEGSIEYSIVKKDYDKYGKLLSSREFNILPIGTEKVERERCIFIDSGSNFKTRFTVQDLNGEVIDFELFRNGEKLIQGVDWRFLERIGEDDSSNIQLNAQETIVEVLHGSFFRENGIYEATYTPRYILEDKKKIVHENVEYLPNSTTKHSELIYGVSIEKTELYVKVLIRSNSKTGESSPYVDYYKVLTK